MVFFILLFMYVIYRIININVFQVPTYLNSYNYD